MNSIKRKGSIAMARKSLKIQANVTPSHDEEDLIYKHVTQYGSAHGIKRVRGSMKVNEDGSETDETHSKPPRKRGRPSGSAIRKPQVFWHALFSEDPPALNYHGSSPLCNARTWTLP